MVKDLESRQARMRECQVRPTNRAKKRSGVKERTDQNGTKDGRNVDQFQPQISKEKEAVSIIKIIEERLWAGGKLPMDAIQRLQEFTRCPELADLLNDLLPPLRKAFESHLFFSKALWQVWNTARIQELRCYEYFIKRLETHKVKTGRKPSLDYYDWNTEDHYDWIDHYEQFGPREEILNRLRPQRKISAKEIRLSIT